jgi:hypothetical protein
VKAQRTPTAWPYLASSAVSQTSAACGGNMALRTVLAYKALGYRVDGLLGWTALSDGVTCSVRERSPFKDTFDTTTLASTTRLTDLVEQWGTILATQHARADKDWDSSVLPGSIEARSTRSPTAITPGFARRCGRGRWTTPTRSHSTTRASRRASDRPPGRIAAHGKA